MVKANQLMTQREKNQLDTSRRQESHAARKTMFIERDLLKKRAESEAKEAKERNGQSAEEDPLSVIGQPSFTKPKTAIDVLLGDSSDEDRHQGGEAAVDSAAELYWHQWSSSKCGATQRRRKVRAVHMNCTSNSTSINDVIAARW